MSKSQRRAAKVINFGVLYGMSPHGLAAATGMSFTEAKKFIDHYFEVRKPIRQYLDKILTQAREQGFVETYFGRRRPTPDVKSSNFYGAVFGRKSCDEYANSRYGSGFDEISDDSAGG